MKFNSSVTYFVWQHSRLRIASTLITVVLLFFITACSSSKKHTDKNAASKEITGSALQKKYAKLLGVPVSDITNDSLYAFVDQWINTSYQYGGQNKSGIDCSGFALMLYRHVYHKKLPRSSEAQYKELVQHKPRKQLSEGDLVFFTTVPGKKISHVGIYLQNDKFVNAANTGVSIADMNLKYWADRYVGGGVPK